MSSRVLEHCYVTSAEAELIEALHGLDSGYGDRIAKVLSDDIDRLVEAREKHPDFAYGQWEAIGYLEAEVGEATREVVKGKPDWEYRMDEELKDVRVVALRMSLREYEHPEEGV